MLTASNVYLDGPTSPVPSYTTPIPKYPSIKWEKTWARVLHSSYQHLIRKKVWKSLNRWHLWMALGQIWVTQSHLHTTDVNISKFQPSTASGLGGVLCLRSKMPATLYRYRFGVLKLSNFFNSMPFVASRPKKLISETVGRKTKTRPHF